MLGLAGEYYGRIWYFRDITESKRAEEEVRKHREKSDENDYAYEHDYD